MSELTRDDVQQILDLIDKAQYGYFELQAGDLRLVVNRTGQPLGGAAAAAPPSSSPPPSVAPAAQPATPPVNHGASAAAAAAPLTAPPASAPTRVDRTGLVPIASPMVGVFYAQSEPGAPPFVDVGSPIDEETTMGLIEVMKVFTAVRAGVSGAVAEILVRNGDFVEYGRTLFYVLPDSSPNAA